MRADPKEKDHSFAGWERERWDTEEGRAGQKEHPMHEPPYERKDMDS